MSNKLNFTKTYWSGHGKHEALKEKLNTLVPFSGEVSEADKNPALEKFRRASNCYYDLYNNGLCNKRHEFRTIFEFDGSGELTQEMVNQADKIMDKIIRAAAKEQGIEVQP